jgi:hypothetical protein
MAVGDGVDNHLRAEAGAATPGRAAVAAPWHGLRVVEPLLSMGCHGGCRSRLPPRSAISATAYRPEVCGKGAMHDVGFAVASCWASFSERRPVDRREHVVTALACRRGSADERRRGDACSA